MKRTNNSGSICIEKATGKYRAALSINGKRVVKRFNTAQEAEQWITTTRADVYRGTFAEPNQITFYQFASHYLEIYCHNVKPKSYAQYLYLLNLLEPIHNAKLQKLTQTDFQQCINNVRSAASTKSKMSSLAKRVMGKALELGLIQKNTAINVKKPKIKKTKMDIFSDEELKRILDTIKSDQRYYLIILTLMYSGIRIGEALGLQAKDVTTDTIDINSTITELYGRALESSAKTEAGERKISVPKELGRQLVEFSKDLCPNDYIFHANNKKPLIYSNVMARWKRILERAGVRYRRLHNLRHTYASKMLGKIPLVNLSIHLGHSSPDVTLRIYSHLVPGSEADIGSKVSEAFKLI